METKTQMVKKHADESSSSFTLCGSRHIPSNACGLETGMLQSGLRYLGPVPPLGHPSHWLPLIPLGGDHGHRSLPCISWHCAWMIAALGTAGCGTLEPGSALPHTLQSPGLLNSIVEPVIHLPAESLTAWGFLHLRSSVPSLHEQSSWPNALRWWFPWTFLVLDWGRRDGKKTQHVTVGLFT